MPIDLGGTALPQLAALTGVALFFSLFFFSGPPFLIGRLQAENILDFVQIKKGRAWKCWADRSLRCEIPNQDPNPFWVIHLTNPGRAENDVYGGLLI